MAITCGLCSHSFPQADPTNAPAKDTENDRHFSLHRYLKFVSSSSRTTGQFVEKGRLARILVAAGGNGEELHATPTHACRHHGKYSRWPAPAPHPTCALLACGGTAGAPPCRGPMP